MKTLALAMSAVCAVGLVAGVGAIAFFAQDLPRLESLADYRPPQVTKVYAADGTTLIGEVFEERRTVIPIEEIPAVMVQALISAEDKNFFEHSGIDYVGIAKAAVGNLMPGARTRGASTLTQQIVKQMLLSNERKLSRKIKEAILAHRLEANFSKQDILSLYLNQIFFGNNRYGIEEASRLYFGKSARDLDVGEAAILASIPKDPNVVNPRANVKRVKERQAYVLRQMVENGYIAEAVALREIAKPLPVQVNPDPPPGGYYVEEVKRILTEKLGEETLKMGGLRVETAMDPKLQKAAEDAMRDGLRELDKRHGWRGARTTVLDRDWDRLEPLLKKRREAAIARVPPEASETDLTDLRGIEFDKLPKADADDLATQARGVRFRKLEVGTEVVARVKDSGKKSATIDLGGPEGTIPFASLAWARKYSPASFTAAPKGADDVLDPGDIVLVRVAKLVTCDDAPRAKGKCTDDVIELALEQTPQVEGALVSIDPNTRHVTALVGGYDHRRSPFNRATQAKRQPGSSFKPFVYAAALEQGQIRAHIPDDAPEEVRTRCIVFHPRQTVYDTPEVIRDKWTGKPWEPRNFERDFFAGPLSLRVALAESKNTVAVKLVGEVGCQPELPLPFEEMQQAGLDRVKDLARRAGIDSSLPDSITAALGSGEVIPAELVNAYATLAMEGRYSPPVFIKRVRSPDGETLYEEKPHYEQPPTWIPEQGPMPAYTGRGLRPELAFVTGQVMRSVVEDPGGTARSLLALGRPIAGKTGTASEHRDAWFVGFTPEVVTGVWVGFDDHQMLGARETGGHAAGPIWLKYMRVAEDVVEHLDWMPPLGVVTAQIDPRTGLLADEHAPVVDTEFYLQGTEPTEMSAPPDQAPTPAEDTLRGDGP